MKKKILIAALCLCSISASAKKEKEEKPEGLVFETVIENPITSVKNQNRSSTCWSFSALGFIEAELLRLDKGEYDLSEMFVVHKTMVDRARNYVRLHGFSSFSPGGSFYDILYCIENYGLVPQEAMPGIMYGDSLPVHSEIDAVAEAYVDAIAKGKLKKLTPVWDKGLSAIYDTYLGECPETFTYEGKDYTPKSFAEELGINPDDYVSLTSYTHQPFYSKFAVEVPDNWRNALSWNLPLDEFMEVMESAVRNGYTFAWGSDVSEEGFSRDGIATAPDISDQATSGSDMAHWVGLSPQEKKEQMALLPELTITQELRQEGYDNWQTQDDHGMVIYGLAKDQNGKEYFMMKNSWGEAGTYKGLWYVSKPFVAYKTMNIIIHKDAIPAAIAAKMK